MTDDPRGHDDGDIIAGPADERDAALDLQLNAVLLSLAQDEGYSAEALTAGLRRTIARIRKGGLNAPD